MNFIRFFLIFLSVFLISCRPHSLEKEVPFANEVKLPEKFRINLNEDHKDGATWQLKDSFDKSLLDNFNAVWHGPEKGIDFNFQSLAAGQTTLTFIKRRYNDTIDVKSYVVKIGR